MAVKINPNDGEADDDGAFDLNVQQTADDHEVKELDKDLGLGASEEKDPDGGADEDELDDDESSSQAKTSEEEADAGTDAERQAIRERKKQDRLNQRQRQRQKIETLERQLANALAANQDMHQRVGNLENTNLGTQAAQIDQALIDIANAETTLKNILADATVKQDGQRAAEATAGLIEMQRRKELAESAKAQLAQTRRAPNKPAPLDPTTMNYAKAFMTENPWYGGPKAADVDSRVLSAIDDALFKEGMLPSSPTYWTELKERAKRYLPHRFTPSKDGTGGNGAYTPSNGERRPNKQPVAGSGSNNGGGGERSKTSYTLSPQRVQAMKEAGFWNDLALRKKMIERYRAADKEAEATRR